jgi:hypothetical protein
VGLKSLKSLNLTNGYPNNNNNNKVKSKPLELFELAGKNSRGRVVLTAKILQNREMYLTRILSTFTVTTFVPV